jgi:hypothetical protein
MFLFLLLLSFIITVAAWLVFWSLVSLLVNSGRYHRQFINGKQPVNAPDGFYRGTAHVLFDKKTPWLGKSFVRVEANGFNIFTPAGAAILKTLTPFYKRFTDNADGNTDAYYFQTRTAPGLKDPDINVIKLDYNAPENPFLIRIILDEIVEVAPDEYLGKIHLKVFPGVFCAIGYFGLKKA